MSQLPVHWYEGMFLRPQHFQAAERYWADLVHTSEAVDHQYNYGLRAIEISPEAVANSQVQINSVRARLRDGSIVSLDAGQAPDRVDLSAAFQKESSVRVFLAVPKLQLGRANVSLNGQGGLHRYAESEQLVPDESKGGNEQEIRLRAMNVRVMLSTQDLSGYELLPIAQIERSTEREATPHLDVKYIPPLLACDAWPGLVRDILRNIYDIIGKKIEMLSQQVLNRGMTLSSQEPGDLDRVLMLSLLNSASCTLAVLVFAQGVHPIVAYTELCRIVGQLSIFGPERRPPGIPQYDHDDLASIFNYVKRHIERLIDSVRDYEYEQRYFVGAGLGMQVTLDPKWLNSDWQWYVGVHKEEITEKECVELLSPGQLDWKLGSSRQVEILFKHRAEGIQLVPLDRAPRALPATRDWIYYEVSRGNAAWRDVFDTQTLAIRVKDSLIVNREALQGQRKIIVSARGKQIPLEFALFAVPTRK